MGYDEGSVLADLPPTLRRELSRVLKGDLIEKLSFLQGASRELIHDLSTKLQPIVFTPGDVIVRAGEHGRHIYFTSNGSVDVIAEDGKTLIRTLSEGDFFGELALLHQQPRTATVRAVGYCDLYTLDREASTRTLARYPDFAAHIKSISEERTVPEAPVQRPTPTPRRGEHGRLESTSLPSLRRMEQSGPRTVRPPSRSVLPRLGGYPGGSASFSLKLSRVFAAWLIVRHRWRVGCPSWLRRDRARLA